MTSLLRSVALSSPGNGVLKLTPKSVRSIFVMALNEARVAPNVSGENPFTVTSRVTGNVVPRIVRSPSISSQESCES